ncbi:hypothetical protein [Aliagarivorans taiwanensis]|uniref:hypothetical protein n=1 Tax=Aliagarivorans taiwanensis TaxID=561966 RepID=UPI0012FAAAD8|nr:hypothetical protein [Aliagarivorans taiwanensis]
MTNTTMLVTTNAPTVGVKGMNNIEQQLQVFDPSKLKEYIFKPFSGVACAVGAYSHARG